MLFLLVFILAINKLIISFRSDSKESNCWSVIYSVACNMSHQKNVSRLILSAVLIILYSLFSKNICHLHQPYYVLLAALGDEGEEVASVALGL